MQVFIAWTEDDIRVLSTAGIDLGRKPELERITVGKAAQWKWDGGTQEDIEKAEKYARKHCTDHTGTGCRQGQKTGRDRYRETPATGIVIPGSIRPVSVALLRSSPIPRQNARLGRPRPIAAPSYLKPIPPLPGHPGRGIFFAISLYIIHKSLI